MSCTFTGIICKLYYGRRREEIAEEIEEQNMRGHIAIDLHDSEVVDSIPQRLSVTNYEFEASIQRRLSAAMSSRPQPSNEQPTIYRVPERIRQHENKACEPRLVSIGSYDHHEQRLPATISSRPQPSNEQPTIYRVPERIRQHENKAYEPRLVSIGPYHHNKQSLVPMEEHKWRYLEAILSRNPAVSLEDYVAKITALEAQARRSYSESITFDSNEFRKMMILDGCFIVELFAKNWKNWNDPIYGWEYGWKDWDDPIYRNEGLTKTVCADMLLSENQLPYCILQCIFSSVFPHEHVDVKLAEAAIGFYDSLLWLPFRDYRRWLGRRLGPYHHLLHLIHCQGCPRTLGRQINSGDLAINLRHRTLRSAEKLDESGIKFKRKAHGHSVLDVGFKKGVMKIPCLYIDDFTIGLFRNLVAFEQCYPSAAFEQCYPRSYFTAYTVFMGTIINTKADFEILRDKGILEHAFNRDEELAFLLNGLTKGNVIMTDDYLSSLYRDFHVYFNTKRRRWRASYWETKRLRWRASLMRDHFGNPWSIIALIGATVMLILTAIQTFFSVYSYARPPHQS